MKITTYAGHSGKGLPTCQTNMRPQSTVMKSKQVGSREGEAVFDFKKKYFRICILT
jgi:hypothetical protein